MRTAREALDLSQAKLAEEYGYSVRTYQKNEGGHNEAGICLAAAFMQAGISANWLLTEEGPMLLSDLQRLADELEQARAREAELEALLDQATAREVDLQTLLDQARSANGVLNVKALAAIIKAALETQQNADTARVAELAAKFYQFALDSGDITPTGIGTGNKSQAA